MARGQKKEKKELTPEKRLQNALVPEGEWPYKLPEGWKWVKIGGIADVVTGSTPSKKKSEYYGNDLPFFKPADLDQGLVESSVEYLSIEGSKHARMIPKLTTLICCIGSIGKTGMAMREGSTNQQINALIPRNVNPWYLYYYAGSEMMKQQLLEKSSSTTISIVNKSKTEQCLMPLAPSESQNKIVHFLDCEFRRLDEAKDQLQSVIDSSEEWKQSILHKAVTGELSAKWRAAHNVELSSWQHMPLKEACIGLKYGTASKSQKEGLVAVIRMGNLQDGEINWSNLVYSNNSEDNEKYCLHSGDVLFNRTNSPELVGKTAIYRGEQPAIYAGYLIKLDYKDFIDGEYLNYIMNSPEEKRYCNQVKSDGVNQSNVSAAKIGEFNIPVPTIDEQHEIVRIVNTYLDNSGAIEEAARNSLDQLETLKKSILTKAFRGELIC